MNLRTWARILVASSFFLSGLAETLSATGLVMEISPDAHWGSGLHSMAIGGPLQMAGAALLLSGRKTRWALGILVCYVALGSLFGNLPQVFNPNVGASAIAGLLSNLAIIGGLLYWLHGERAPGQDAIAAESLTRNNVYTGQPLAYAYDSETQSPGAAESAGNVVS
ncbi:MAG TPA: hypothetical protein VNH83_21515 [Bryobacteraceae bacterium]|nr:hypothetical protein [Bryobacteraceae bacterium]